MALAILLGSSLGYLGLGAQPPTAEWGVLIADGKNFMTTPGGCRSSPASPSCSPASASACWATASPTLLRRRCDDAARCCSTSAACARDLPARRAASRRGGRRRPRRARRARCWASSANPAPARASPCAPSCGLCRPPGQVGGQVLWRGPRPDRRCRSRRLRRVRGGEIAHDLPGADDGAQPGAARRPADRREPRGRTPSSAPARGATRAIELLDLVGIPAAAPRGSTTIRTSSPAACGSAR